MTITKKTLFILLSFFTINAVAQKDTDASEMEIQGVIDACIAMRDAVAAGDTAELRLSAQKLRDAGIIQFRGLTSKDESTASLKGHLVFHEAFADSLAIGNTSVYEEADHINRKLSRRKRGQTSDGSYRTKTCYVKAGESSKWTFLSKGHQELAVVAEAGGLVTMKIRVTNNAGLDIHYNDTKNVKKGMPHRKTSFELPDNRKNTVELEVINCGNRDCSFVVISN